MERAVLLDHLAKAEKHVLEGRQRVTRQQDLIADLRRGRHDTGDAELLLRQFNELLALHLATRERLRGELGEQQH